MSPAPRSEATALGDRLDTRGNRGDWSGMNSHVHLRNMGTPTQTETSQRIGFDGTQWVMQGVEQ